MLFCEKDILIEKGILLFIIGLEQKVQVDVQIEVNGVLKIVKIIGVIDWIDWLDGVMRIFDYKSGLCIDKDVSGIVEGYFDQILL